MFGTAFEIVKTYPLLFGALSLGSIILFIGSLAALPWLVVRIPPDYFEHAAPPPSAFRDRHPALRWIIVGAKNLVGFVLLVMGFVMLVLPGQGLLSMFVGLILMNFPRKRRLEIWLVRKRPVLKALNWLRARAKHPPLRVLSRQSDQAPGERPT
ncbi:MAG: PGPGW domain-containing protein [Planctomycetota bacterium]